jgi:hypothetical protein
MDFSQGLFSPPEWRLLAGIMPEIRCECISPIVCEFGFALLSVSLVCSPLLAQNLGSGKPAPAKVASKMLIVGDWVVREQWPHTLNTINAPDNVTVLHPGQCIHVAIVADGDNRDTFLQQTKLSFQIQYAGETLNHELSGLGQVKQMKPEGGDFVTQVLGSAGIANPIPTLASLGVSADNWCVPADARDGSVTLEGAIETPKGHQKLKESTVQIETIETGSKRTFKDIQEFEGFLTRYYRQPNPARLFPALQFFSADDKARANAGTTQGTGAFFSAALKAAPEAARDFMSRVSSQTGFTQAFGLLVLQNAGYDIDPLLNAMSDEDRQKFGKRPVFPDPYDFSAAGRDLPTRLDMLWGIFGATGHYESMRQIASALAWRSDFDDFDKMRKTGQRPSELTPSIMRGVSYGAAGWSLSSFQRTDPLAADYIEFMQASPEVPQGVKAELKGLSTNPAFRRGDHN